VPPVGFAPSRRAPSRRAPSRLARLERKVRRLECGTTKSRLPDGLAPSEAKVRAASRRRPDFFVLVLSATVLVLVLDGFSNGSRGDHWSRRLQWLWINTRDGYTVRRRVRVPLIRIRGFPEYEYEYETEHEQNDAPKPSVDRVDLR
jgi:hypothetical protein